MMQFALTVCGVLFALLGLFLTVFSLSSTGDGYYGGPALLVGGIIVLAAVKIIGILSEIRDKLKDPNAS